MKNKLAAALSGALSPAQELLRTTQIASQQPCMDLGTMSSLPEGLQMLAQQGLLPVSSQRLQVHELCIACHCDS